jgi:hypothetical protein
VLGALLLVAICAAGASAAITRVPDNRNTRANLFDIRTAAATSKGALVRHTIRTYRPWRSKELRSRGNQPRMICVFVWKSESDPDGRHDFEVCARFSEGRLRGSVVRAHPRRRVASFLVRRPDSHSISYAFNEKAIGSPLAYQWQAVTGFTGKGCPRDPPFQFGCDDSAPTGGVQVHDLN